ncbi:hypothetical protein ACERJO_11750 [Halalkalibacter sp. AB-rgal2]|uniref:hypothetical protein n=1 Tax=Halalkalibacter sp. AB-rgal2 TaxID=3242695 RepID=UPI00359EE35D
MTFGDQTIQRIQRKIFGLQTVGHSLGLGMERQAKMKAPWTDRTGDTRRAIHGGADRIPNGTTIYLAHGNKIGSFLEDGTGIHGPIGAPYDIVPVNTQALWWRGARHPVAAVRKHPGMAPRPIIHPTVESNIQNIKQKVKSYMEG